MHSLANNTQGEVSGWNAQKGSLKGLNSAETMPFILCPSSVSWLKLIDLTGTLAKGPITWEQMRVGHSVAQSCLTLCDPIVGSMPGSSVHGIFRARILEWVAIFFSRESSRPRNRTQVSHIAGRYCTNYVRSPKRRKESFKNYKFTWEVKQELW